jgi:hypothetical protein
MIGAILNTAAARSRRVAPKQIRLVELDQGVVSELRVEIVDLRPSAHDDVGVEPNYIARTDEVEFGSYRVEFPLNLTRMEAGWMQCRSPRSRYTADVGAMLGSVDLPCRFPAFGKHECTDGQNAAQAGLLPRLTAPLHAQLHEATGHARSLKHRRPQDKRRS